MKERITEVSIDSTIAGIFPHIVVGSLQGNIRNGDHQPQIWNMIDQKSQEIAQSMDAESIRLIDGIRLGKQAYRQLGKDPNRYRLSAEALMRRIVKGQPLYPINTAVDVLNFVSLSTGITIGGFDHEKVKGAVRLGIGEPGEEFEAIGRGTLNVESLPVYRDRDGAIGNPTSDCMRTRILPETSSVLMLITGFYGPEPVIPVLEQLKELLSRYCYLENAFIGINH